MNEQLKQVRDKISDRIMLHTGNAQMIPDPVPNIGLQEALNIIDDAIAQDAESKDVHVAASKYLDTIEIAELMYGDYEGGQVIDAFVAGAKWQRELNKEKEQFNPDVWSYVNDNFPEATLKEKSQMYAVGIWSLLKAAEHWNKKNNNEKQE